VTRVLDLADPRQLTIALGPDLLLLAGAMLLLIWAAWRPDSNKHQRAIATAVNRARMIALMPFAVTGK
jgi:hypothetical protein